MKRCIGHRIAVFVLFSAFVPFLFGLEDIGRGYAALGNKPNWNKTDPNQIYYLIPLGLAWLSSIVPLMPLMWLVAVLLAPYAVLSIILLVAPPIGVPACIVLGVWYSYFFALRRSLREHPATRQVEGTHVS